MVLPSGIEGLDVANGLRRVLGKRPLYLSMLRKFIAGQQCVVADIRQALEAGHWDRAERPAHTLKGVAGNIGATAIQHLAYKLETAIKEHRPRQELDDRLLAVKFPLEELIRQLEEQMTTAPPRTAVIVDRALLKDVCDQLESLLTFDDAAVIGVLEANADLLHAAFPDHFHLIENGIRAFDFETAHKALQAAHECTV
jgi:two-component system sensor histidine kinase/response regulator